MAEESNIEVLSTVTFSDEALARLKAISPRLHITMQPVRKAEDISNEIWGRTEVLYTAEVLPNPKSAAQLKWVQFHYAGIDFALENPLFKKPDIQFTNLSGAASPQIAEYCLGLLIAQGHHMAAVIKNMARAEWPADRWHRFTPRELRDSTVGIVGYGSIGRELARLLLPFNCTILAAKKDAMHPQDEGYTPIGLGDPDGDFFTRLYPIQALHSMLKECDFLVVCVPLTPATRGLIGKKELDSIKQGAYLVDVSRGGVVDVNALKEAIEDGQLAGAALDVFAEEPLPPNNPLWQLPNTIISPHIAGVSPQYKQRAIELFVVNLQRYVDGDPLFNRFDPERGY
jgi:phosphoglycerate dehydrogenase-like enzyme